IYCAFQRDIYIQRFRESWSRPLAFLKQRGWKLHDRLPLIGREIHEPEAVPEDLIPITREDMDLVSDLCQQDDTAAEKLSTAELQERFDGGWIAHDTFWRLDERGAFALEQRGPWAAVTLFFAQPAAWGATLRAATAQARALGVHEVYFTIDVHEMQRRDALERQGFHEVDAGVYYVREAD
ncbi:MAG: hypothetical protein GY778_25440, partial [bacterium]|nr:hypothetical protein [bacterium]